MKTWNTIGTMRGFGMAAMGLTASLTASIALADGTISLEPYTGPISGAPAPESLLVADFEGDLPVGISFLPETPTIVDGNSVSPGSKSAMLGQWDPFQLPTVQVAFNPKVLGAIAPRFVGFVVTESAGFGGGVAAPITVTVWYEDGSTQAATFDVLSEPSNTSDDMLVRVDSVVGVQSITIASVIPISIDNIMYESNAEPLVDSFVQDDVNGDGISDSVWYRARHAASDTAISNIWLWGGDAPTSLAPSLAAPAPKAKMVGIGDADGDKRADILWLDSKSGSMWVWLMGGVTTNVHLIDANAKGWSVVGFSDVNGDKRADIVLRRIVGALTEIRLIALNGTTVIDDRLTKLVGQFDAAYVGDMDRDGRADLLLKQKRASGCTTEVYYTSELAGDVGGVGGEFTVPARLSDMNGASELPLDRKYVVAGLADMTGDGAADVVFRHSSGDVVIWDMDDMMVSSKTVLAQRATGMTLIGFPDIDGDGARDVLLRNRKGDVKTWKVIGAAVLESAHGKLPKQWAPAASGK
jgi:hypothetical protein